MPGLLPVARAAVIPDKGYAPAIAGIWGREGGGVGEGLPELKFSSIILSFKTSRH